LAYRQYDFLDVPVKHPVGDFARYWFDSRRSIGTPRMDDMDARKLFRVVPWMMMLRTESNGDLRYELCGDGCSSTFGFSYEGMIFGEGLPEEAVTTRQAEFQTASVERKPLFSKTELPIEGKEDVTVYRGVFPFVKPDGEMEGVAVVLAPVEQRLSVLP
jgi:hypothetical protein